MKQLATLNVCGMTYRVMLASSIERPALEESEGECDADEGVIYLRASLARNRTRLRDTLIHELVHAFVDATGLAYVLKGKLKESRDWEDVEETIARVATPHIVQLVEANGSRLWIK